MKTAESILELLDRQTTVYHNKSQKRAITIKTRVFVKKFLNHVKESNDNGHLTDILSQSEI